ncbi:hypothetical protein GBA52_023068 [Prunus armeniaca]|nr:hypothetical protein GBA52_023068 [Prunus armeniaca]
MRQLQDSVLSKYAISRGYREIILEMDSKVLVEGTRGASNYGLWSVKPLMDEYDNYRASLATLDRIRCLGI